MHVFTHSVNTRRKMSLSFSLSVTQCYSSIGATTALTSLTTNAGGTDTISGNIRTSGAQTYNNAVLVGATHSRVFDGGRSLSATLTVFLSSLPLTSLKNEIVTCWPTGVLATR